MMIRPTLSLLLLCSNYCVQAFVVSVPSPRRTRLWQLVNDHDNTLATWTEPSTEATSTILVQQQQQARAGVIANAFVPNTFDPLPWTQNCHVQTILGFFLRDSAAAFVPRQGGAATARILKALLQRQPKEARVNNYWDHRQRLETPDGDWFHVDTKYAATDNDSIRKHVILIHGLESNSNSTLSLQMAQAYHAQNDDTQVTCLNFRSCSIDEKGQVLLNDLPGAYHLGFTDDLKQYLEWNRQQLLQENRTQEIYLSGFSLGANVVLKLLGELGPEALTRYNIQGAAVGCAPFEQETNARALARPGINRLVYTQTLLKSLQTKALDHWRRFGNTSNPMDQAAVTWYDYQQDRGAQLRDQVQRVGWKVSQGLNSLLGPVDPAVDLSWKPTLSTNLQAMQQSWKEFVDAIPTLMESPDSVDTPLSDQLSHWGQTLTAGLSDLRRGVPVETIAAASVLAGLGTHQVMDSWPVSLALAGATAYASIHQGIVGHAARLVGTAGVAGSAGVEQALNQARSWLAQQIPAPPSIPQAPLVRISSAAFNARDDTADMPAANGERVQSAFVTRDMQDFVANAAASSSPSSLFDLPRALAAETITEFDDAFIAPIYGFRDCWDYYRQTSSLYFLENITVPTLVINARDDPFFDPSVFPVEKTMEGGGVAPIKMVRSESGGHLGFCFHQVDEEELARLDQQPTQNSWMPLELARFVQHVQTTKKEEQQQ